MCAKKKSLIKKFIFKVLKLTTLFVVLIMVIVLGLIGYEMVQYVNETDYITPDQLVLKGTSYVYDCNGNVIMPLYADKNREIVSGKDIPKNLKNAFVAIEDKRFYSHRGIDVVRLFGAVINLIKPGGNKYGASTITQQVVKNITGDDQRSLKRKIQEQRRALELEKKLTKDEILEIYMNIIYMGSNTYGVQAASKLYFNKDVKDLTIAECASIAGITNRPALYDPFVKNGKENNLKRQKRILYEMLSCKFISDEEYKTAINEPLKFASPDSVAARAVTTQPYFIDQVVTDVKKDLMANGYAESIAFKTIYGGGLKIYTTMDRKVQNAMDEVFQNGKNFSIVNKVAGQPQAAMAIVDAKTGQVRGLYGGIGVKKGSPLNRASSSLMKRQPGSTFKPIAVYGPAINEKKITPATIIQDTPLYLDSSNPNKEYPVNYDHTHMGAVCIQNAVRYSLNVVAAKVWKDFLGPNLSLEYLRRVNIDRSDERYVSIALGGLKTGVNPLQMASAYIPFVNKGVYVEPCTYTKVESGNGDILLKKDQKKNMVYEEAGAFVTTNMLRTVVKQGGTGYPYGLIQGGAMPSAGKTGTTGDNKDKWFVGFSPYYVGATWYGYDKPTALTGTEYNRALVIWHEVMERVHKGISPVEFTVPAGVERRSICSKTGKLATEECPSHGSVVDTFFIEGTEPTEECSRHAD